jgi:hypothetical protein
MVVGFILLLVSWLVLLLMTIGRLAPSFPLSLGAYTVSVAGLATGLYGLVQGAGQPRL